MWKNIGYEQCLSFINCQLSPPKGTSDYVRTAIRPTITISRMTGSGGRTIASKLADYLQTQTPVDPPWTVFDKNLIDKVLEDHRLPKSTAEFTPEGHKPMFRDMVEEFLGLHPSSWILVRQTAQTILHLAEMGHVILVGRGANIITSRLENAFHVRLVGSLAKRTKRVEEVYDLDPHRALDFIHREDKGRRRYLKEHYGKDIDDPMLYHLVINTDRVGYEDAAHLIADEIIHHFHLVRHTQRVMC